MTTLAMFPRPKDPRTTRWYSIVFGVPLDSLGTSGVTVTPSSNPSVPTGASEWTTGGDAVTGGPLIVSNAQLSTDGLGVKFQLSGGVPGAAYSVGAEVVDEDGNDLFGSVILLVKGL